MATVPSAVEFGGVTPILRVSDMALSVHFYTGILGFTLHFVDNDGNAFASLSRGKTNLFLSVGDQGHYGSWLWIGVSDVDVLYEELRTRVAKVRHPPANYPWGSREMQVEDPDRNVLRIGSENKPGEPFGDWLDMRGVRWKRVGQGWQRVTS